jgi:hypothetical protein
MVEWRHGEVVVVAEEASKGRKMAGGNGGSPSH